MQLKLIALAVAGVVAAPAFAQSNVIVSGRLSESYSSFNHDSFGLREQQESGSRLNFKGTEQISSDLSAFFELEHRFLADVGMTNGASSTAPGVFWGEKAWLGLKSNTVGSLTLGRIFSPAYSMVGGSMDAFGGDTIVSTNIGKRGRESNYFDNGARYDSPVWGGFSFALAVSTPDGLQGSQNSSSTANGAGNGGTGEKEPAYGLNAQYNLGKTLHVEAYWQHDVSQDNGRAGTAAAGGTTFAIGSVAPNDHFNTTGLGISYDFGFMSVATNGYYSKPYEIKTGDVTVYGNTTNRNARGMLFNTIVPIGSGQFRAQYAIKDEKACATNACVSEAYAPRFRQLGVGYWYDLSKRTTIRTQATFASQLSGVQTFVTQGASATTSGFNDNNGQGNHYGHQTGYEVGLIHVF